jgi:hypothetical protein
VAFLCTPDNDNDEVRIRFRVRTFAGYILKFYKGTDRRGVY